MPHVILLAAIGAGLYSGYRALMRMTQAMAEELQQKEADAAFQRAQTRSGTKDLGSLKLDPRSGVYRPGDTSQ